MGTTKLKPRHYETTFGYAPYSFSYFGLHIAAKARNGRGGRNLQLPIAEELKLRLFSLTIKINPPIIMLS